MTLLSDLRILEEKEKGNIVIEPFDVTSLGTNSYDVRIASYYFKENNDADSVCLDHPVEVALLWDGPYGAINHIPVEGHQTILAHTVEIIGGRNGITAEMKARSTIGRCRLSVCKCSGWGDVGYINRWTMEITNFGRTKLWIPISMRVAQICFYDVGPTIRAYQGKYGQEREWKSEDMLPRPDLAV
jgi:dCTP deaminase